jgi:ADP-ribose pyrophosphatase YjhB (NUDIX family)
MNSKWLEWTQSLSAIAQNGLTYQTSPFDRERYRQIRTIAAEMIAATSGLGVSATEKQISADEGYSTPKVDVRGAVFSDEGILMVRERRDGLWTLPGGWADVSDSPSEAVEKEILQESGYEAKARKLTAVYDRNRHGHPPYVFHVYKIFFLCELTGGAPATSIETDGVDFFAEDNLPELSLPRVTAAQIKRTFEHYRNPDLATDFD